MAEDNEPKPPELCKLPSNSHSGDSHDRHSVSDNEDLNQDASIQATEVSAMERDIDLETAQQALEKSATARSGTSQQDSKLVCLYCLPLFCGSAS